MGCSKSSSKGEVYSNKILPQETRETSNRKPNFTSKITEKRTKSHKVKRNHKDPNRNRWKRNERNTSND